MPRFGSKPCLLRWLKCTGAAALLATSHGSVAQDMKVTRAEKRLQQIEVWAKSDFHTIDTEGDGTASWEEITSNHEDILVGVNWGESEVLEQFDHNNDGVLQQNEYMVFISYLVDERLKQLMTDSSDSSAKSTAALSGAANELAAAEVDDAMVPDSSVVTWVDVPLVDSAGLAIPTVKGGYERVAFEALDDKELVNLKGEVIGEIEDVVASKDGIEKGLLVESGGFLGLATTDIFVPIETIYIVGEQLVWETLLSADAVRAQEGFLYDDTFTSLMED